MTLETVLVEVIRRSDYSSEEEYDATIERLEAAGWQLLREVTRATFDGTFSYTILYKEIWSGKHE